VLAAFDVLNRLSELSASASRGSVSRRVHTKDLASRLFPTRGKQPQVEFAGKIRGVCLVRSPKVDNLAALGVLDLDRIRSRSRRLERDSLFPIAHVGLGFGPIVASSLIVIF
jgi:hypothetical protein